MICGHLVFKIPKKTLSGLDDVLLLLIIQQSRFLLNCVACLYQDRE